MFEQKRFAGRHLLTFESQKLNYFGKKGGKNNVMETIHPCSPQVASLYQRWLGKRLFSDKRL